MKRQRKLRALQVAFPLVLIVALGHALSVAGEEASVLWQRGDAHKMHWAQTPDEGFTGAAVSLSQARLADSFKCTTPGPVRSIHLWGSFRNDVLPAKGPDALTLEIGIFSDMPAGEGRLSRPGELLWSHKFSPGHYSACKVHDGPEDWYKPGTDLYLRADHRSTYQYDFCVEPDAVNLEAGRVYWLAAMNATVGATCEFGWKTTAHQVRFDGDAEYLQCECDGWIEMAYPVEHWYGLESLDLAFVVSSGIDPAPQYDLGDAPDSSNNVPRAAMTAYAEDVEANFPTVHEAGPPPFGPLHRHPRERFFLGRWVSFETQADIGVDDDAVTNLAPQHDVANRDGGDDGLRLPVIMPTREAATLCYRVTATECREQPVFVNVWCDWNRDGDWDDGVGRDANTAIPEWAVQNQQITLAGAGTFTFNTPPFLCSHPNPDQIDPMWLRITVAELPWQPEGVGFVGGAGPEEGYAYGETEDYLVQPLAQETHAACDWADVSVPPLIQGQLAAATVQIRGGGAVVLGWIDFDADGNLEPAEMIHDRFLPDGVHVIRFTVPAFVTLGRTVARFHISRHGFLNAGDGDCDAEVEDHEVWISGVPFAEKAWCQFPDLTPHNVDVRTSSSDGQFRMLADDFECVRPGLLEHVRLWGAWQNDCPGRIQKIRLSIHPDDPAGQDGADRGNSYAKPGPEVLWQQEVSEGQFQMALYHEAQIARAWWRDPEEGQTIEGEDGQVWQIDIDVPPDGAFVQQGSPDQPRIYWLAVQVETTGGKFGWTSRQWPEHSLADAVWDARAADPRTWRELYYPLCHPYYDLERNSVDLAFCLLFSPQDIPWQPTSQPMMATHCPAVETMCPAMATQCPMTPTQCPAQITECPTIETVCPTTETQCPARATQCPTLLTTCPISLTQCYSMPTSCPPVETMCPMSQTSCPAMLTNCPPVETSCPPSVTHCPVMPTLCPADLTGCGVCPPPCPPPCPPTCEASDETAVPLVSVCPTVEADCPTVGELIAVSEASQLP